MTRVIYGRLAADKPLAVELVPATDCRQMLGSVLGREPTEAEVRAEQARVAGFEPSREQILFLDQARTPDNRVAWLNFSLYGLWPDEPLDAREKEIVETIRGGAHVHLRLPTLSAEAIAEYVPPSDRVVRARLAKVGDSSITWEVKTVLYVEPIPGPPLTKAQLEENLAKESARLAGTAVDLDAWRLRAEAVANYEANRHRGKPATEDEIRKEFDRMVRAELSVGREAILFLKTSSAEQAALTYRLVGMLCDEPENAQGMDNLEKAVRDMIRKGAQHVFW